MLVHFLLEFSPPLSGLLVSTLLSESTTIATNQPTNQTNKQKAKMQREISRECSTPKEPSWSSKDIEWGCWQEESPPTLSELLGCRQTNVPLLLQAIGQKRKKIFFQKNQSHNNPLFPSSSLAGPDHMALDPILMQTSLPKDQSNQRLARMDLVRTLMQMEGLVEGQKLARMDLVRTLMQKNLLLLLLFLLLLLLLRRRPHLQFLRSLCLAKKGTLVVKMVFSFSFSFSFFLLFPFFFFFFFQINWPIRMDLDLDRNI